MAPIMFLLYIRILMIQKILSLYVNTSKALSMGSYAISPGFLYIHGFPLFGFCLCDISSSIFFHLPLGLDWELMFLCLSSSNTSLNFWTFSDSHGIRRTFTSFSAPSLSSLDISSSLKYSQCSSCSSTLGNHPLYNQFLSLNFLQKVRLM